MLVGTLIGETPAEVFNFQTKAESSLKFICKITPV